MFNIFGLKVRVKYLKIKDGLGLCGFFDPEKKLIVIDEGLNEKEKAETMIHEFMHALANRLSWGQSIPMPLEEVLCDQIAKAMVENFDIKLKK